MANADILMYICICVSATKKSSWSLGNLCNHDLFESHYTGQIEAALISPQVLKTIQYAIIIYIQIILNIKHRYMNQYLTLYKSKSKLSWSTLHRGGGTISTRRRWRSLCRMGQSGRGRWCLKSTWMLNHIFGMTDVNLRQNVFHIYP